MNAFASVAEIPLHQEASCEVRASPEDVFEPGSEPELVDQAGCLVGGRSVLILVGRPAGQ